MDLQIKRSKLGLSQSQLARLAGLPRLTICLHELGDRKLKPEEAEKIDGALRKEIWQTRLRLEELESAMPTE